jgi:hypothetical protein
LSASSKPQFMQRVSVTISFTINVPTYSDEPEESTDTVATRLGPMMENISKQYENVEISAESEVIDG